MIELRCAGRDALTPGEASVVRDAVRSGGALLFPTDTLYGLGADPHAAAGLGAVFRLKGRAPDKPLPVLIAEPSLVGRFAASVPPPWRRLMEQFWPGPLTLLFPALPSLPPGVRSGAGEVALRIPGNSLCRAVLAAAGGSLTGTSANAAGAAGTGDPEVALRGLAGAVDVFVNGGTLPASAVSTLLGMDETGTVRILRAGAVPESAWRRALSSVDNAASAGV